MAPRRSLFHSRRCLYLLYLTAINSLLVRYGPLSENQLVDLLRQDNDLALETLLSPHLAITCLIQVRALSYRQGLIGLPE